MIKLRGRLSIRSSSESFSLKNYGEEPVAIHKIRMVPEPGEKLFVSDIRIGRNSQFSCAGPFKASILNNLPPLRFEPLVAGMDLTVCLGIDDGATCEIVLDADVISLGKEDVAPPMSLLFPVGRTQVRGNLTEIAVTKRLFEALEHGSLNLTITKGPNVPPYQEAPFESFESFEMRIREGRIRPTRPIWFGPGDRFDVTFAGRDAESFSPVDVVGILEMTENKHAERTP